MTSDLNPQQREAVRYLDGPLLVLAGAGSGKTRVITRKIAYLIGDCGYPAHAMAAITFTNKAAREMRERVGDLLPGRGAEGLTVATFHALGLQLLRREGRHLGYKPGFSVLDAHDSVQILGDLLKAPDKASVKRAAAAISAWKNALVAPADALATAADADAERAARAYRGYQETLRAYQAVDFDDLIRLPVELLRDHAELRDAWQNRLRYLLVDEYQDTNGAQYALLRLLAGPAARLTAVGDDDQAIYAWRGADVGNLRRLQEDLPQLRVIALTQNYRSSQRILRTANSLIRNNPRLAEKNLWSEIGPGDPVEVVTCRDERHEAESVAARIAARRFETRGRWADFAVLYRGNHQARVFEEAMRTAKIPYVLSGGQSFFARAEIKDVTAYLRLLANPDDDPAFLRAVTTPRRGIGAGSLERLGGYAGERRSSLFAALAGEDCATRLGPRQLEPLRQFTDFIGRMTERAHREPAGKVLDDLLAAIRYAEWLDSSEDERSARGKWANVRDFADWLARKGEEEGRTLIELTQTVALMTLLEGREEEDADAVRLSTLHAAKGLEFPHVFLVGVEEEILPHRECLEGERLEEERRLLYVGITRARRHLTMTCCARRRRGGELQVCTPSRFLDELDADSLRRSGTGDTPEDRRQGRERLAALKAMLGAPG